MEVIPVVSKKDRKRFIDFPHDLYEGDPNYVPELFLDQKDVLSEKKNPFFKHSKAQLFLAKKGGKTLGRIAAIRNNNYNKVANKNIGFFGFFDVIDDYGVCEKLLNTAKEWLQKEGLDGAIGPANFTLNETAGLLIDGFDSPPPIKLTYNKKYYKDFLERYGFYKVMDMYSYALKSSTVAEKPLRLAKRLEERLKSRGITISKVNMKNFNKEVGRIREVYSGAWDHNWGFVAPTKAEFEHIAEGLKLIIDEDYVYLAEKDGKLIGFVVAFPDMNQILINVKRGRLLPTGIFKLLFQRKKIKRVRIMLLGVLDEYRKTGIEAIFYAKIIENAKAKGITDGDASWILENNQMMRKGLENLNGKIDKTYRMYEIKW